MSFGFQISIRLSKVTKYRCSFEPVNMRTTEEYLNDYYNKVNELADKGELWRLRVTEVEFVSEIERLRKFEEEMKDCKTLNQYHIQRNIESSVAVMLMNRMTNEEMRRQIENNLNEI